MSPAASKNISPTPPEVKVDGVKYGRDYLEADYQYQTTKVARQENGVVRVIPESTNLTFRTTRDVPRLGVMLVGWGGNNGSTLTATILANQLGLHWRTKEGIQRPNYFGSITQASTVCMGVDQATNEEVYVPMNSLLPMVDPNDLVLDGWDISSLDLALSMERAQVLDYDLQRQLKPHLKGLKPRRSIYNKNFIAANQENRADNVIVGTKQEQLEHIRKDIREFKTKSGVDKVILLWTANTERFCDIEKGLNDTAESLLRSIKENKDEISPSTIFAVASILEGCAYLNGSPQNTFVPGCLELASANNIFIGGDDFKSGQTKFKSVLVDFLVNAGIKPRSIVSYNHLGNNDGKNLSAPEQFRSKEISKSNVVDDMVKANQILYEEGEKPDHCVVIKYVPHVGDSKRALDEYTSEISMGGRSTIVVHNTCEDSLLAAPIILDLVIITELCHRIAFRVNGQGNQEFQNFNSVLSILSYLCKAPLVPSNTPLINSLSRQRSCIENILRACLGLPPINHMGLEHKLSRPELWISETVHKENNGHKHHENGTNGKIDLNL